MKRATIISGHHTWQTKPLSSQEAEKFEMFVYDNINKFTKFQFEDVNAIGDTSTVILGPHATRDLIVIIKEIS